MSIKEEIEHLREVAYLHMDSIKWYLDQDIDRLRKMCPHTNVVSYPDPSGNNGGWTECTDCGAEL